MYNDILLLYTTSKTNAFSSKKVILDTLFKLQEISWMANVFLGLEKKIIQLKNINKKFDELRITKMISEKFSHLDLGESVVVRVQQAK